MLLSKDSRQADNKGDNYSSFLTRKKTTFKLLLNIILAEYFVISTRTINYIKWKWIKSIIVETYKINKKQIIFLEK